MGILIVVERPERWPMDVPAVRVVAARAYLTDPEFATSRGSVVVNLCRSYSYQTLGYYVSLLAEARGHRPQPSATTLQDMAERSLFKQVAGDLEELIHESLGRLRTKTFVLSIYFGRNTARRHKRLAAALYNLFRAPLLRARFTRSRAGWQLENISPIAVSDIPEAHRPFALEAAKAYFAGRHWSSRTRKPPLAQLAILVDEDEEEPPSNERALEKFERAAHRLGMATEFIDRGDAARVGTFDALFIRATTRVNHYTYRFARRAETEGMVVMDDPRSILRCTNKVFLKELLERVHVNMPLTLIVDEQNRGQVGHLLGFPCVLKVPDSAFSVGVEKASDEAELQQVLERMLVDSELVVAQEFLPTSFDWRVGVIDGKPLFVCRYFMAPKHWQILRHEGGKRTSWGKVESLPVEAAPKEVLATALKACNAVGDGFYGVDLKQSGKRCYVMEVNDNPNVDAGYEDSILGDELYHRIMDVFMQRILAQRQRLR